MLFRSQLYRHLRMKTSNYLEKSRNSSYNFIDPELLKFLANEFSSVHFISSDSEGQGF